MIEVQATGESEAEIVASVRDLRVTFPTRSGEVHALRGVNLDIHAGEILAVVGESGSGKTVFGLSLLGLLPAAARPVVEGSVRVAGIDMIAQAGGPARRARRHWLGAVFQDPQTTRNPTMRNGPQMLERGIDIDQAFSNLREAGIADPEQRVRQFPHELSGGLRQRAMIAMAIGTADEAKFRSTEAKPSGAGARSGPRLVVADEPTTALDVSVQAQVVLLFDRIRRDYGCSVVFVTHDLGVAASIADRIAVFYGGRVREIGAAADVVLRPRHPYTRDLLRARLSIDDIHAVSIAGDPPDPRREPRSCAYADRCLDVQDECRSADPALLPDPGSAAPRGTSRVSTRSRTRRRPPRQSPASEREAERAGSRCWSCATSRRPSRCGRDELSDWDGASCTPSVTSR